MLNYIKPDPVTGEVIAGASTREYVATQTQLITDYTVAGRVAEQVGWLSNPNLISAWHSRSSHDQRDFKRWLADIVIQNTKARLVEGSNILEIKYTASTPSEAESVAEALRKAYTDVSLEFRHEDAERNAAWYANLMINTKQALDEAVAAETEFEKANGLVMQENKLDADSARLQSLTQEGAPLSTPMPPSTDSSSAAMQLAGVEASLAASQKILGPNNPEIQDLQSKRAALAALVEKNKANEVVESERLASGGVAALNRAVSEQRAKVLNQSEKIGKLNVLHQDVELRQTEYERASSKAAEFREEANSADVGVTSLGTAATPKAPVFPNYMLVLPGSAALGLFVGVFVSLLMELLGRRVRSADDLIMDGAAPLICVIPAPEDNTVGPRKARASSRRPLWPANRGTVGV
jgi:uncharacterized protein involved in exopolysaccharide biosynthesis